MTKTPIKITTIEEYLNFDDGTDKHYELEDGVLVEMPPGTGKHEAIITFLLVKFFLEIQKMGLPSIVFTGNQRIISQLFPGLTLTTEQVLRA